jgi:S-adenosylmethionine:tRNA-ribosyltransferase-isomerase (queuine synthetase)
MLDSMYVTMSISTGLYPNLDLWNANKLHYITLHVGVGEDHAFKSVCNLFYKLINTEVFTVSKDQASKLDH